MRIWRVYNVLMLVSLVFAKPKVKRDNNGNGSCGNGGTGSKCDTLDTCGTDPAAPGPKPQAPIPPVPGSQTPVLYPHAARPRATRPRAPSRIPKARAPGILPAFAPVAPGQDATAGEEGIGTAHYDHGYGKGYGRARGGQNRGCGSDSSEECSGSLPGSMGASHGGNAGEVDIVEGRADFHSLSPKGIPSSAPARSPTLASVPTPGYRVAFAIPRAPPPAPASPPPPVPRAPARRPKIPSPSPRKPSSPPVLPKAPRPKTPKSPTQAPKTPTPAPKAPTSKPKAPSEDKGCDGNGEDGGSSGSCDATTSENGYAQKPCETCPRLFIAQPMRVCGTDGQTYRSPCDLRYSACVKGDRFLKQLKNGPC